MVVMQLQRQLIKVRLKLFKRLVRICNPNHILKGFAIRFLPFQLHETNLFYDNYNEHCKCL